MQNFKKFKFTYQELSEQDQHERAHAHTLVSETQTMQHDITITLFRLNSKQKFSLFSQKRGSKALQNPEQCNLAPLVTLSRSDNKIITDSASQEKVNIFSGTLR